MTAAVLACVLWAGPACPRAATSGADFLKIPIGAAPSAMGGAYTAVPDELSAVFWNPAGIVERRSVGVQFGHLTWFDGTSVEQVSAMASTGRTGLGAGFLLFRAPQVDETDPASALADHRTAAVSDLSARFCVARRFGESFLAGGTVHIVEQSLPGGQPGSLGAGAGFVWHDEERRVRIGASFGDWGAPFVSGTDTSGWPTHLRLGLSWIPLGDPWAEGNRLLLSAEVQKVRDPSPPQWHLGAELTFAGVLSLRTGIQHGGAQGPLTAGLAYRAGPVVLEYAFVPYLELGATHRLSLSLYFGSAPRPAPPLASPPTELRAAVNGGRLYLSWHAPSENPAGYVVYFSHGPGGIERAPRPVTKGNLYVLPDYEPDATYYFEVSSLDEDGHEGERSVPLAFAPQIPVEELIAEIERDAVVPEPPEIAMAPWGEDARMEFEWPVLAGRPAGDARGAAAARSGASSRARPARTGADRARTVAPAQHPAASSQANEAVPVPKREPETVPLAVPIATAIPALVDRPWRLSAASSAGVLRLEWAAPTQAPIGYRIYVALRRGGPYRPIVQDVLKGTRFEIQGLPAGRAFHFVVTAVAADGTESHYSESVGAIP